MLHFATVPGSYDIAVILTGDKDFMPAMSRTRQKGKRVVLASMRRGCNHALQKQDSRVAGSLIRDYDIIWLDDAERLNRLVSKIDEEGSVSATFLLEVVRR